MQELKAALRDELVSMDAEDERVRDELAADGSIFEGYHPRMEAVHRRNAERLRQLLEAHGWPGQRLAGERGAFAAWRIAQHAIGEPDFQRRCLELLRAAAAAGDLPAWQPAFLEDRVRMFEGRPQLYGTQFESGPNGEAVPYPIEDPEGVDARRRAIGLEPMAERMQRAEPMPPIDPETRARREREYEAWLRRVGWRT